LVSHTLQRNEYEQITLKNLCRSQCEASYIVVLHILQSEVMITYLAQFLSLPPLGHFTLQSSIICKVRSLKLYLAEFLLIQLSVPVHIQLVEDLVCSFTYTTPI
jgi:hypothetical protein